MEVEKSKLHIITGPNMVINNIIKNNKKGGKSTYIR